MKKHRESLLPGRRVAALKEREKRNITDMFRAMGYNGPLEFDEKHGGRTRFEVRDAEDGEDRKIGVIVVGPDIYPGLNVANANSVMDPLPAVAHEITHYDRWNSGRELPHGYLEDIDEAMTSLQAACAFRGLSSLHIQQLISDALERLVAYIQKQNNLHDNSEVDHG